MWETLFFIVCWKSFLSRRRTHKVERRTWFFSCQVPFSTDRPPVRHGHCLSTMWKRNGVGSFPSHGRRRQSFHSWHQGFKDSKVWNSLCHFGAFSVEIKFLVLAHRSQNPSRPAYFGSGTQESEDAIRSREGVDGLAGGSAMTDKSKSFSGSQVQRLTQGSLFFCFHFNDYSQILLFLNV